MLSSAIVVFSVSSVCYSNDARMTRWPSSLTASPLLHHYGDTTVLATLLAALAAGVATAVLLGSTTSIVITQSCPIGNPPPPCGPATHPWIEHDPNLWAGLLAFALVLTVGTGLAAIRRRT
jgi:hypothetical protein